MKLEINMAQSTRVDRNNVMRSCNGTNVLLPYYQMRQSRIWSTKPENYSRVMSWFMFRPNGTFVLAPMDSFTALILDRRSFRKGFKKKNAVGLVLRFSGIL
jgi:hypothetical protein